MPLFLLVGDSNFTFFVLSLGEDDCKRALSWQVALVYQELNLLKWGTSGANLMPRNFSSEKSGTVGEFSEGCCGSEAGGMMPHEHFWGVASSSSPHRAAPGSQVGSRDPHHETQMDVPTSTETLGAGLC